MSVGLDDDDDDIECRKVQKHGGEECKNGNGNEKCSALQNYILMSLQLPLCTLHLDCAVSLRAIQAVNITNLFLFLGS
jgi:hypothetical protein